MIPRSMVRPAGVLLAAWLAGCGRADLEAWSLGENPGGGAGAGGSGASGSGAGSTGSAAQGSGGATTGSAAQGSGGATTGSTSSSGQTGAGGGSTCPGVGTACSDCMSTSCPDIWCGCYENPECFPLAQCLNGCSGDQACVQACMTAHEGGISALYLVSDCAATTCDAWCQGGNELQPCGECIAENCDDEFNECLADAECVALYNCLNGCAPLDLACQQACYAAHGAGVPKLQALLECAADQCDGPCN